MGPIRPVVQGQPPLGQLGGHGDVLRAEGGDVNGDPLAHGMIHDLEGLAQSGAPPLGQGHLVVGALVFEAVAPPHRSADLDDLAGASQRGVVGHAMEALDHLGPGSAQAQDEATPRQFVEANRRHGHQRRGARVERQDARPDLRLPGHGSQEPHGRDGVGRIGLARPQVLDAQVLESLGVLGELVRVVPHPHRRAQLHGRLLSGPSGPIPQ